MKTIYFGEFKRNEDGTYDVDDLKYDWDEMSECQMSVYLGGVIGASVEKMKKAGVVGSLYIEVMVDNDVWKEVRDD